MAWLNVGFSWKNSRLLFRHLFDFIRELSTTSHVTFNFLIFAFVDANRNWQSNRFFFVTGNLCRPIAIFRANDFR